MRCRPGAPLLSLLGAVLAVPAFAQPPPSSVVAPSRPDQRPVEAGRRATPPNSARPALAVPAVPPFRLQTVVVEGSSLPAGELEAAWRPFRGQALDRSGLQQLSDEIAGLYARHDIAIYSIVVPAQTFAEGQVNVRVLEGAVEDVQIIGSQGRKDRALLERYAAHLMSERPLRRTTLERYVSLIRDIPGLDTRLAFERGASDGGVRIRLESKSRPVQLGFAVNNRGTAFLGRTQAQADLYLNSLVRQGDRTRLTAALPTDVERFQSFGAEHTQPVGSDGLTVTATANYLRTHPKGTDIKGEATAAGLQATYPWIRGYERSLYVTVGVDGVNSENAFLGFNFAVDRIRAARAAVSYSHQTSTAFLSASASASQGVDGLGARGDPGLTDLDFQKLNGRLGGAVAIGPRLALRLNLAGQLSGDRLPGTELFALGGDEFGRGYEASIIAGDEGLAGSAELAFRPPAPATFEGSEAYVFVDGGKVWYRGRLGAPGSSARLASAGLGVRAKVAERVVVQLEGAKPFDNPLPRLDDRGWRGIFLVRSLF